MDSLIRFFKSRLGIFVIFCVSITVTVAAVWIIFENPLGRFYWLLLWWGLPMLIMMFWTRHDHFNVEHPKLVLTQITKIDDWWDSRSRNHVRQKFAFFIIISGPIPLIWLHNINATEMGTGRQVRIPEFIKQPTEFKGSNTRERVRNMLRRVRYKQYVYLLHSLTSGLYKIGFTKHPQRRLRDIEREVGDNNLEYVCLIETDNMRQLEKELHLKYAGKRLEGEWFDLTEDDVEYISGLSKNKVETTVA